ncbi:MAG: hypothetical protein ACYDH5_09740 [Acidimicrobiales bacterium]
MDLDIWLNDHLVAKAIQKGKKVFIRYTDGAVQAHGLETPLLSCSLPTPGPCRTDRTRAFLEGLLPSPRGKPYV